MHAFKDNEGRSWTVDLTFGSVRRVLGLLGINLLQLCEDEEPPLLTRLGTDVMLLCDVIFALIKPQADEQGVGDEEWAASMGGGAILEAQTAFYEEIVSFFLSQGRPDVAQAARKQKAMIDAVVAANQRTMEAVNVEKTVSSIYGGSDTSSPGSAGSTPPPSP